MGYLRTITVKTAVRISIRVLKYALLSAGVLILLLIALISLPIGHDLITWQANRFIENQGWPISVGKVSLSLTGKIELTRIEIFTDNRDTLIYAGDIRIACRFLPLLSNRVIVSDIFIDDVHANLVADSSGTLNLLAIFSKSTPGEEDDNTPGTPWEIQLGKVHLQNIRFSYVDSSGGISIKQNLGLADVDFDSFSLLKKQIDIGTLRIERANGSATVSSSSPDTVETQPAPWKFSAREIELAEIRYIYENPKSRQKMIASLTKARTSVKQLDLAGSSLIVNELMLDAPQLTFKASQLTIADTSQQLASAKSTGNNWSIQCKELAISKGDFAMDTLGSADTSQLAKWLPVHGINTSIKDIIYSTNAAGCNMERLTLSMADQVFVHSGTLHVQTDSLLNGKLSVGLIASAGENYTSSFLKEDTVSITAVIDGSPQELNIERFELTALSGAEILVSGTMTDVMNIQEAGGDLTFQTNPISRDQLMQLAAYLNQDWNLPQFNPVALNGKVKNKFNAPEFDIVANSQSGRIAMDGSFNIERMQCMFNANLTDVKAAQVFGEEYPKVITGQVKWEGIVGGLNELSGAGAVYISHIAYADFESSDLNLDFNIANQTGQFSICADDTNLACDLSGEFGMVESEYHGLLFGYFMIREGTTILIPGKTGITSQVKASFFSDSKHLEGSLDLREIAFSNKDQSTTLDSIHGTLQMTDTMWDTRLSGDFFNAEMNGNSSFTEFDKSIRHIGFGKIFRSDTSHFLNADELAALPAFDVKVSVHHHPVFNLLFPDTVFDFNHTSLIIGKKEGEQQVKLEFTSDSVRYMDIQSHGANLVLIADDRNVNGALTIDSIQVNDNETGRVEIKLDVLPGKIGCSLFIADTIGLPVYKLEAEAIKVKDRILFRSPSPEWVLNHDVWNLTPPDFLTWDIPTNEFIANVSLHHEKMHINVTGRSSDSLKLDLQDVLISKIFSPAISKHMPDGILNADVVYSARETQYIAFNIDARKLVFEGQVMEHITSKGYLNVDSEGFLKSEMFAQLNDSATIDIRIIPGETKASRNIQARFENVPVYILEPFVGEYINELDGYASGTIHISGNDLHPMMDGNIDMQAISLNIVPLQAWFAIPDGSIKIEKSHFYFNNFVVLDSSQKRLLVNGSLDLENPSEATSDLHIRMDDVKIMNTTIKDNPEFFGAIVVNSGLDITGPVTSPNIKGSIKLQEGTDITFRQSQDLTALETQRTVTFASLALDSSQNELQLDRIKELSGLPLIQTTIEINPKSKFNFDVSSGYNIHVSIAGNGQLNYTMLPNNTMNLVGNYEIKEGTAELKFTGWPMKYFTITKGSSVRWDGDVSDPDVNIEATTKVKGSYVNPVDNKTRYVDFIVSMKLQDEVSKLQVIFDVESNDQYITSVLNTLPEEEVMRQAINLLLFESINLPNIESSSNYVSSQINSFWETQLNSITKTSFKRVDLSFGIDTYTQHNAGGAEEEKTSVTYEMQRKFMSDRATVKLSGRFNDDSEVGNQSNTMIENFIFEYQLDTLERRFLKLYTKKDYEDILDGEVTKSGVGFIYRRSYPDFRSIWQRKKRASPEIGELTPSKD